MTLPTACPLPAAVPPCAPVEPRVGVHAGVSLSASGAAALPPHTRGDTGLAAREEAPAATQPSAPEREAAEAAQRLALQTLVAVSEARDARAAAAVWAEAWAQGGVLARVTLAWLQDDGSLKLLGSSDAARLEDLTVAEPALLAALGEAVDQAEAVCWRAGSRQAAAIAPQPTEGTEAAMPGWGAIVWAQHQLGQARRRAWVATVPLAVHGACVGALCLEGGGRVDSPPEDAAGASPDAADGVHPAGSSAHTATDARAGWTLSATALERWTHLGALVAPVLALRFEQDLPLWQRTRRAAQRWWQAPEGAAVRQRRTLWAMVAAAAAVWLLVPSGVTVGGQARLEGAVQRVLAAGSDGYIHAVHARPGDSVRAGDPVLELADRELQLERQRWMSQLAQAQDNAASALARGDRGQAAVHQGQADEAQAQLTLADSRVERARLVAPFDGIVVEGDWSQQLGTPVKEGTALVTVAPSGAYRVVVEVDERDVAGVQPGQSGALALSALPWDRIALRVQRVSPVATAVEGRSVFEVEAVPLSVPANLRPGLRGHAQIEAGQAPLAWQWLKRGAEHLRRAWWAWQW